MILPKIIHQTWKDGNLSPLQQARVETVKRQYPHHTYKFWTDADNDNWITCRYPEFKDFYITLSAIQKADFIRYLYLHSFGGLYFDLDVELYKPLDLPSADVILTHMEAGSPLLDPFFLAGAVDNAFFYDLCHSIAQGRLFRILSKSAPGSVVDQTFYKTGPQMLSKFYLLNKTKFKIALITEAFDPPNYGIHHNDNTWCKA
jgi:mannosyltransferase OCH1-like enzyme